MGVKSGARQDVNNAKGSKRSRSKANELGVPSQQNLDHDSELMENISNIKRKSEQGPRSGQPDAKDNKCERKRAKKKSKRLQKKFVSMQYTRSPKLRFTIGAHNNLQIVKQIMKNSMEGGDKAAREALLTGRVQKIQARRVKVSKLPEEDDEEERPLVEKGKAEEGKSKPRSKKRSYEEIPIYERKHFVKRRSGKEKSQVFQRLKLKFREGEDDSLIGSSESESSSNRSRQLRHGA